MVCMSWEIFTVKARQAYPPKDSINVLIIWKMNLLVVPEAIDKSCMHNEQWISYENFSVFGQIENLWMD